MSTILDKYKYELAPMPFLDRDVVVFSMGTGKHNFKLNGIDYLYEISWSKQETQAALSYSIHDVISIQYGEDRPETSSNADGRYRVTCSLDYVTHSRIGYYINPGVQALIESLYPAYEYLLDYQDRYLASHKRLNTSKSLACFEKNSLSYISNLTTKGELMPYLISPIEAERHIAETKLKQLK